MHNRLRIFDHSLIRRLRDTQSQNVNNVTLTIIPSKWGPILAARNPVGNWFWLCEWNAFCCQSTSRLKVSSSTSGIVVPEITIPWVVEMRSNSLNSKPRMHSRNKDRITSCSTFTVQWRLLGTRINDGASLPCFVVCVARVEPMKPNSVDVTVWGCDRASRKGFEG